MPSKTTSEICNEGLTAHLVNVLADANGITPGTVRAWRYPKDKGGKGNPLDQAARYITKVHEYNPANAREAADHFHELVDELDARAGIKQSCRHESLSACLGSKVKEGTDVVLLLLPGQHNLKTLRAALTEVAEERASLERLDACLREEIKCLEESEGER